MARLNYRPTDLIKQIPFNGLRGKDEVEVDMVLYDKTAPMKLMDEFSVVKNRQDRRMQVVDGNANARVYDWGISEGQN